MKYLKLKKYLFCLLAFILLFGFVNAQDSNQVKGLKHDPDDKLFPLIQEGKCGLFAQQTQNQLQGYIVNLETTTKYSIEELLQEPGCITEGYHAGIRSPMLHLIADRPISCLKFLNTFEKYYTIKRKAPELFIKALNSKNMEGETFLDYVEHQFLKNYYYSEETQNAALSIIAFACSKGGVYSKYSYKKCPLMDKK